MSPIKGQTKSQGIQILGLGGMSHCPGSIHVQEDKRKLSINDVGTVALT